MSSVLPSSACAFRFPPPAAVVVVVVVPLVSLSNAALKFAFVVAPVATATASSYAWLCTLTARPEQSPALCATSSSNSLHHLTAVAVLQAMEGPPNNVINNGSQEETKGQKVRNEQTRNIQKVQKCTEMYQESMLLIPLHVGMNSTRTATKHERNDRNTTHKKQNTSTHL